MSEEAKIVSNKEGSVEKTDRGMFDFLKKKKESPEPVVDQEEEISTGLEKMQVSESEPEEVKVEENKEEEKEKVEIFEAKDKLHRSGSSSSSSSSDEDNTEGVEKKKKKKGLKEKLKEKVENPDEDTSVPVEKYEEPVAPEAKKGFLEKIKEKLPHKQPKPEEVPPPPAHAPVVESHVEEPVVKSAVEQEPHAEKKGFMDKIKEKLPGYHPKAEEEKN